VLAQVLCFLKHEFGPVLSVEDVRQPPGRDGAVGDVREQRRQCHERVDIALSARVHHVRPGLDRLGGEEQAGADHLDRQESGVEPLTITQPGV